MRFPDSIGLLYSTFTAFLGFEVNEGEYKVMGMAPYGDARYLDELHRIVKLHEDGSVS
jgi:carbamoyltransferase